MIKTIRQLERKVLRRLILNGIRASYSISVHDGGEVVVLNSKSVKELFEGMFSVDEERLFFHKEGESIGIVHLVYGNEGWDVISDYTVGLEPLMVGPNEVGEKFLERLATGVENFPESGVT